MRDKKYVNARWLAGIICQMITAGVPLRCWRSDLVSFSDILVISILVQASRKPVPISYIGSLFTVRRNRKKTQFSM